MSHFAKVNWMTNKVEWVIVAEQDFINSGAVGDSLNWVQTSFHTYGGIHSEGRQPLRKNYACVNDTYDKGRDAFIPPKPYPSWILNEDTCLWDAPTPMPDDDQRYTWNEETTDWDLIEVE
jgi:hypothetical protein